MRSGIKRFIRGHETASTSADYNDVDYGDIDHNRNLLLLELVRSAVMLSTSIQTAYSPDPVNQNSHRLYSDAWRIEFDRIAAEVATALTSEEISIEHIGSTSVQGLCPKPVIDVLVGVVSLDVFAN